MYEARARIAELEAELERERMRLAACGVVAGANTRDSAREARQMLPEYRSASLCDVERAVDREMAERERREAARDAANRIEGDEVLARLRSGNATPEDQYNVANSLAYLWAQDGLLSEAQREVDRLREQLAEVERPLDAQMARLNANLLAANRARMDAERELEAARADAERWRERAEKAERAYADMAKRGTWKEAASYSEYWRVRAEQAERALDAARKERT